MFSPDGVLGDIPYEKMQDARKAGGMPAVQVKSPEGEAGWIPFNRLQDVVTADGQMVTRGYPSSGGATGSDTFGYDPLGRVTSVTHSAGGVASTSYAGANMTVTDENGHATKHRLVWGQRRTKPKWSPLREE